MRTSFHHQPASAHFVEDFREESGSVGRRRAMRNDRTNAALAGAVAIGFGVVTFVGDGGAGRYVGSDVEQELEVAAVAGLAASQMEGERQAVEIDLEVDFGREAAARAAERLIVLPPFAPAAETWARTTVESNICTKRALSLSASLFRLSTTRTSNACSAGSS